MREPIIARMLATAQPDGRLGKFILDTAIGATTLLNLGFSGPELDRAIGCILREQAASGQFSPMPRHPEKINVLRGVAILLVFRKC